MYKRTVCKTYSAFSDPTSSQEYVLYLWKLVIFVGNNYAAIMNDYMWMPGCGIPETEKVICMNRTYPLFMKTVT